jgi:hypothetical protein
MDAGDPALIGICVTPFRTGECLSFSLLPYETVGALKFLIFDRISLPPVHQDLVFNGQVLDDALSLQSYGVRARSRLFLLTGPPIHRNVSTVFPPLGEVQRPFSIGTVVMSHSLASLSPEDSSMEQLRAADLRQNRALLDRRMFQRALAQYERTEEYFERGHRAVFPTVIADPPEAPSETSLPAPYLVVPSGDWVFED